MTLVHAPTPGRAASTLAIPGVTIAAGLCLVLAGCASVPAAKTSVASATAAAPAPTPGYDWFYHADSRRASLAYGVQDSDDLRLGLECDAGRGKLELSAVAPTGVREIRLESGGDTETFIAQGEPSQLHDGDFLTAQSRTDAPIFQRFRRVGWIAQWHGNEREAFVPHPAAVSNIERFFAFCG